MKQKILPDNEQSLDDLIVKARSDARLQELMQGKKPDTGENVLLVSIRQGTYTLEDGKRINDKAFIRLAYVNDELYGINGDFKLVTAKEYVCSIVGKAADICQHNNRLFYCSNHANGGIVGPVFDSKDMARKYQKEISSICSLGNKVYYGDTTGTIFTYPNGKKVVQQELNLPVNAMCAFENKLYAACGPIIHQLITLDSSLYLMEIARRPEAIRNMCVFNGELLDCGQYGIWKTLQKESVFKAGVNAIGEAPKSFVEKWRK
jgi:hypothetical protein